MNTSSLAGKVVLVTGGASGIGKAVCLRLAKAGCAVAVADISEGRIQETVAEIQQSGASQVAGIRVDVRDESLVDAMVAQVVAKFGKLDILVHSAAILRGRDSGPRMLYQLAKEEIDEVIDINLKGTFLVNKAVAAVMVHQKSGQIFNISSSSGVKARAFDSVYSASKFGVVGLTQALAEEVRRSNVKACCIMPDAIDTPLWQQNGPIQAPDFCIPSDRVAEVIEFLAAMPADTIIDSLLVSAFRGRSKSRGAPAT